MKKFTNQRNQFIYDQQKILESIESTDEQFDSLRQKLNSIKDNILNEFDLFKKESLQIYDDSYQLITQSINESYQKSKEIINIIPSSISDRLHNEISKINTDYINTKQALIKSIYLVKSDILRQQDSIINEFEEKKESWNSNRFRYLIERAKNRFLPITPINYDSIYSNFYNDQQKFNSCFKKAISDLSLLIPPNQFSQEALKNWWCKVEELLQFHDNFIDQFTNQFQSKMNQNIEENNKFVSDIESELFELTKIMSNSEDSRNAQYIIDEINPLCKTNENANLQFLEKVKSYFCYSRENLKKSFDSIFDFYQKMIENHQNYINDLADREAKEAEEKMKLENDKKSAIEKLEIEINESKKKISILFSEDEINDETVHCKQLLSQIEQEYRNYYEKVSALYEEQPPKVTQICEQYEKVFLDFLKLRKIQRNSKPEKNSKKIAKTKNQSKQKDNRSKSQISESFKIECGIEFEAFEPLSVLPSFPDFFEFLSTQKKDKNASKSEKGRKSSIGRKNSLKSPSKSGKSSSKSGSQQKMSSLSLIDFNEYEIPSFELNDVIPKIDDKISIFIPLPSMDDFNEWFGQFKADYMNFFYNFFECHLKKSENEKNKKELINELNENLRILQPRFSSIEVNFAEERKIEIASQKDQLDLHFRRISMQFNSLVSKFKTNFDNSERLITSEIESLKKFSNDLKLQKNGRNLAFHHENFRISDKNCQSKIADFFNGQEKSLTDFFNFFKTKNDRFKNVCFSQKDGTYSEEEKEILLTHFENMEKQMNEIQKSFTKSFQISKTKLENLHKEIVKEFDLSFQFHSIDVKFLDDNQSIQIEFMRKFDSLKTQNYHQQQEIQKSLDEIDIIINKSKKVDSILNDPIENHSNEINLILNCLEFLRVKILNRSLFLNQLKSDIINDTTVFKLDLNQEQTLKMISQVDEPNINSNLKKTSSKSKISKTKVKQSKNQNKKSDQENKAKTFSFASEIEKMKNDFVSRLTKISVDYYSQFKTRKYEITRPDEIPHQQNDYLSKINELWENLANSEKSILNDSILKFRYQVSSAQSKVKEAEKRIFMIFIDFCSKKDENQLNLAYQKFDEELNGLQKEKEKNCSLLDFKMIDKNNSSQLDSLIESEQKRIQKEREFISKVSNQIFEIEKNNVNNFLNRLNYLTALSLSLFDKFILIEDLIQGPVAENEKRKTMIEMKKNQIRLMNLNASNNFYKRPFQTRNWPKSNQILKMLSLFSTSKKDENFQNDIELNDEISEDFLKNKRRKSKNGFTNDSLQNDNQKEALRPDSTKQSGRKQKESKNKKAKVSNDDENELKSYDTPIHRTVIIEKNRALDDFSGKLEKRAKKFNDFVNSLETEEEIFENFWQKRISIIRPITNSLPKLDEASNI